VLRAAVMGAVVVIGGLVGRRAQPLPALAAAVLGLIVVDPFLARTPGFAMSVLATAAIVLAARPVAARLGRVMPRPVAVALAVPTVAQIACTPVLVVAFGQIGVWAVPANVVAGVAVAPATVVGVLCAVSAVPLPGIASALAWIAAVPAAWLAGVARVFAALPGAGLALPSRVAPVYVTAAAAAALVLLAVVIRRRRLHAMLGAWPP
jgi:competence protein ComEC